MKTRVLLVALLVAVALMLGVGLGFTLTYFFPRNTQPPMATTATVVRQVQSLSQLVTVKYVMEKVVILEDVELLGESRVMLLAHGVVKAGVDLSELKPEHIEISDRKITLKLPRERITDAYLDDSRTEVIEHKTGLLRRFDKNLQQEARRNAIDDIRRAARLAGITKDAKQRAQQQIESFLRVAGFDEVQFVE